MRLLRIARALHPLLARNAYSVRSVRLSSSAARVAQDVPKETPPDSPQGSPHIDTNEDTHGVHFYRAEPLPQGAEPPPVQSGFEFLPEIPRIPLGKTMHIDHNDIETYFRPLIQCHWYVGRVRAAARDVEILTLDKLFRFKNFEATVKFFNELADMSLNENHHAHCACDYARIYVSIYTHSGYCNTQTESGQWISELIPGLTLRDVRFAIRAERLHQRYLADGLANTLVPSENERLRDWSLEQLKLRYPPSQKPGTMYGTEPHKE